MRTHLIAVLPLFAGAAAAAGQAEYEFFLVTSFNPGYDLAETFVVDINEQNEAIGSDTFGGFRWTEQDDKIQLPSNGAERINEAGQILYDGSVYDIAAGSFSFLPDAPHPYPSVNANAFNNNGVVVGSEYTNGPGCEPFDCPLDCSFNYVYDPINGARNIDVPDLRSFRDVNEDNVAIGVIVSECDNTRGVVYNLDTDEMINLSDLLPPIDYLGLPAQTKPVSISDAGHVVGKAVYGNEPETPFIWTEEDGFTFLAEPEGAQYGYIHPARVNIHGHVIGTALDENGQGLGDWRSVIWLTPDNPQYLDELVDLPTDFLLDGVYGINDSGWITGFGHPGPGWATSRGVVLKPIAPPADPTDLNGDGAVDSTDLNMLLGAFGCTGGGCAGDVDGDGDTDSADLNELLAVFGA